MPAMIYGFSVVRKTQQLKVVGIIDEEPYGGMRTVSRGRIFLPVDLTEKLNMARVQRHAQLAARAAARPT